jgi:imidazolonepropionase-like amidohydrolase
LNHGVTTIRNPGGPTEQSVALRENVSERKIIGPQIFTAGQLLNTPQIPVPFVEKQVQTEQDVRQEVRNQVATGVDYVKLYVGLTPELVKAAINEAHSNGIKVIGHLYMTSWTDAADLGIDALTHGVPVSPFLLSEANQQKFLEARDHPFNHFLWLDLVDLNGPEINEMIKALVSNNIPVDPTLDIYEAIIKEYPLNQYLWPKVLQLTKMLYDNGVTILSGSDIPNFELVPGASLHHELELLVEAGIPPLEVIKIATRNGAQALGIEKDVGTIVPGKQADMMILSDNPMDDISNTKKIEAVISDGQFVN